MFPFPRTSLTRNESKFTYSNNKKLRMESLEQKNLLAGDVAVSVLGGDLFLEGDAADNNVELVGTATPGEFLLNGAGTTFDGSAGPLTVTGVTGNVSVDFSDGGSNRVQLGEAVDTLNLSGDVSILGGAGSETLNITNSVISGDVRFLDSAGGYGGNVSATDTTITGDLTSESVAEFSDIGLLRSTVDGSVRLVSEGTGITQSVLDFTEATIGEDVRFRSNADIAETEFDGVVVGDDVVLRSAEGDDLVNIIASTIDDDLYITTGAGIDDVLIEESHIDDKLRISTGADDDTAFVVDSTVGRSVLITLGNGSNASEIDGVDAGRSLTILGRGVNDIFLSAVTTTHFVTIVTASGDDLVFMDQVTTHSALVSTKAGMDEVTINESAFEYLFVLLGSGDDTLELEGVTVERFAFLHGGGGNDTLIDVEDSNDIHFELDFAFEEFES